MDVNMLLNNTLAIFFFFFFFFLNINQYLGQSEIFGTIGLLSEQKLLGILQLRFTMEKEFESDEWLKQYAMDLVGYFQTNWFKKKKMEEKNVAFI